MDGRKQDTDHNEAPADAKTMAAADVWKKLAKTYEVLASDKWKRRHFDELNLPDRHSFTNTCADLVLMPHYRGELLYHEHVANSLSTPLGAEISVSVGSVILHRCLADQRKVITMLGLDLMVLYLADLARRDAEGADNLAMSLSEEICDAVLTRREHFGFGIEMGTAFASWRDEQRKPFLAGLTKIIMVEFLKHEDASDRAAAARASQEVIEWSMLQLQERSKEFEQEVRVALGKHLIEQARQWQMQHLPKLAITFVLAHIDDVRRIENKAFRAIIRGLEPSLRIQISEAATEQEEEPVPNGSTD